MMKRRLIGTERTINVYRKGNSEVLVDPTQEIKVDSIPLDRLKQIVTDKTDDPMLYDFYKLNEQQLAKLISLLNVTVVPDFDVFEYYLECYGIYD